MMEFLRNWEHNPANPKNIQISSTLFLALEGLLAKIDPDTLTVDEKRAYDFAVTGVREKKKRIRNRQAYTVIVNAPDELKQAALENYRLTKKLGG